MAHLALWRCGCGRVARLTGALNIIARPTLVGAVVERTIVGSELGSRYRESMPHTPSPSLPDARMPVIELSRSRVGFQDSAGRPPLSVSLGESRRLSALAVLSEPRDSTKRSSTTRSLAHLVRQCTATGECLLLDIGQVKSRTRRVNTHVRLWRVAVSLVEAPWQRHGACWRRAALRRGRARSPRATRRTRATRRPCVARW